MPLLLASNTASASAENVLKSTTGVAAVAPPPVAMLRLTKMLEPLSWKASTPTKPIELAVALRPMYLVALPETGFIRAMARLALLTCTPIARSLVSLASITLSLLKSVQYGPLAPKNIVTFSAPTLSVVTDLVPPLPLRVTVEAGPFSKASDPLTNT